MFIKWLASCDLSDSVREALVRFVNGTTVWWGRDNTQLLKALQPKRRKLNDNSIF